MSMDGLAQNCVMNDISLIMTCTYITLHAPQVQAASQTVRQFVVAV